MKQSKSNLQSIYHPSVLCQTIKTEQWLHMMAQLGLTLVETNGSRYWFKQTTPNDCFYFIMTPEPGTNSDVWIFHEFEQTMGKRISCAGTSFFSPSHILLLRCEVSESESAVTSYYFQYRNYRLLKRFRRNSMFSSIFFLIGVVISFLQFPAYAAALFPYVLVNGLLLFHFLISYLSFRKDCLHRGYANPAKKPHRPGY